MRFYSVVKRPYWLALDSLLKDNVRIFVKIYILSLFRYVFLNQNISHSMCFFKLKKRSCLRSVDAAWSKVEFCAEYGAGVYLCTRPNQHRRKARDCPRCATAV